MDGDGDSEACGRCAMSSVTGTMEAADDPFAGDRIEVSDRAARRVSPSAWLSGVTTRLNHLASRIVHGRGRDRDR
jgi:hypothetical protein